MGKKLVLVLLLLISITISAMAKRNVPNPNTGNPQLDSLLLKINSEFMLADSLILDKLSAQVYINGTSRPTKLGRTAKYLVNAVPFEAHKDRVTAVEALCKLRYQDPCQLQFTPISIRTNSKKGRRVLNESFQVLMPIYSFKRMKDNGSNKSYVAPFTDDGLKKYDFHLRLDTMDYEGKPHIVINYSPKHEHHTLGSGYMLVDKNRHLKALKFVGRVDFGLVEYFLTFYFNHSINTIMPEKNDVSIRYNYLGTEGINRFDCFYTFDEFNIIEKENKRQDNLNLTETYDVGDHDKVAMYSPRAIGLSAEEDSLLNEANIQSYNNKRTLIQQLPERLVGSSNINAFGNNLKIYGPLAPAAFYFDKHDGIMIRQRMRYSRLFDSGKSFMFRPDFGYSFKMKELRYKLTGEWIYNPRRRGGFSLSASNRSSEFSSKFQKQVNEILQDTSSLTFKDLGIEYYRRHEFKLEHSIELKNGLMFYAGASYNYRDPVKHGSRKMPQEQVNSLVNNYYADFNPYLRLTWTPRQYYHYENNQKLYIASYYPTFSIEVAKGLKNVMSSSSNYERVEFDVHQTIKLDAVRRLSYHLSSGAFFRQKGEYFIAYSFFSRKMFPSTWDDHIGGTFNLLNDYWYNSSPAYCQAHVMYETPFLLLHHIRPLSKYIIKERIYLSNLVADGKNGYTEMGYGIGNNYFNLGVFTSLVGLQFHEIGVKATIEIESHW